jgi:PAT family beta-lactamase induction signal transducer AmpG
MWISSVKDHYVRIRQEIQGLVAIGLLGLMGGVLNKIIRTWPRLWGNDVGLPVRVFDILALLGMCYSMKLFWAPFLSLKLPSWIPFSPRRFWIAVHLWIFSILFWVLSYAHIFSGFIFFACIATLFMLDGNYSMLVVACQKDIVPTDMRGIPESFCLNGYRAGMTVAVSGAMLLSDHAWSWPLLYQCSAGLCVLMGALVLGISTFNALDLAPSQAFQGVRYGFLTPIKQLFQHPDIRKILFILLLYRVADHLWTPNQELFFLHMGFSKQYYSMQDVWNFWGSSAGIFISGYCIRRFSTLQVMQWGLWLQMGVFLALFWASFGAPLVVLSFLCVLQRIVLNFALTSVFAFQVMAVNLAQAVTQLSIFTALAHGNSQLVSSYAGWLITYFGWSGMILVTSFTCLPALFLMHRVSKQGLFRG